MVYVAKLLPCCICIMIVAAYGSQWSGFVKLSSLSLITHIVSLSICKALVFYCPFTIPCTHLPSFLFTPSFLNESTPPMPGFCCTFMYRRSTEFTTFFASKFSTYVQTIVGRRAYGTSIIQTLFPTNTTIIKTIRPTLKTTFIAPNQSANHASYW